MVKEVATSIITVATLMSCLVACSGSDSDAELRAKIADLEEELEEQQIASNDLDSESTTTDAEPESTTTDAEPESITADAEPETKDIEAPDLTIISKHPTIDCLNGVFDKFVNVFGMYVVATPEAPESFVNHSAGVLAQYLDNDEDGYVDNQKVLDFLVEANRVVPLWSQSDSESFFEDTDRGALCEERVTFGASMFLNDRWALGGIETSGDWDTNLEEIWHIITWGWDHVYPVDFGVMRGNSQIGEAMDAARGGQFQVPPETYPEEAWYKYYDPTCEYACQIYEYFYWILMANIGALDPQYTDKCERSKPEWYVCTKEELQQVDPKAYDLLNNQGFKLPTRIPNGLYRESSGRETLPSAESQDLRGTQEIDACKLIGPDGALSLAHDRPIQRLNTVGSIKTVVLFADFANVSANESTEDIFSIISPGAENFFRDQSYGRLSLSLFPHHEWLRLSGPTSTYRDALTSYTGHRDWIQEAMNLADDSVDFSDTDAVLVVSPPNAGDIPYGPALMGWSAAYADDGSLNADGRYIANAVTSGADLTYWGDLWYPHEMGHSLGLPDLYGATISGRAGFTRPFSLMDDIGSTAPGYMGYSRWILKWLDDSQVACINGNTTVALTPIETHGGLKIALVPFDQTRALVIESRRKIGYDIALEREGAVVYIVDTENGFGGGSGEGPMEVLNNAQALLPNESLTYENVTITVQEANLTGDIIQIEIND